MNVTHSLTIYDEDGFIAIANPSTYKSFVSSDWEYDQLLSHFVNEMNKDSLIIWETEPGGGEWIINILQQPSGKKVFRQFQKVIEISSGELFLVNYTDLTMAAQFEDEKIPSEQNSELSIILQNGKYEITVMQMFDPLAKYETEEEFDLRDSSFEIIIKPAENINGKIEKVFFTS
jgi:hypothetical protein